MICLLAIFAVIFVIFDFGRYDMSALNMQAH